MDTPARRPYRRRTWSVLAAVVTASVGPVQIIADPNGRGVPRAYAQAIATQQAGSPFLVVRRALSGREAPQLLVQALGDPLAEWSITPDGTVYRVRAGHGGGLPRVHRVKTGSGGVAKLRALVHEIGLDEPRSDNGQPASPGEFIEVGYRHPSGRYVLSIVEASDPGLARITRALEHPADLGATRPAVAYEPTVLRVFGIEGVAPADRVAGRWPLRVTTLTDVTLRCIALRGVEATRLRAEVMRVATLRPNNVIGSGGASLLWLRSGQRTVQLAVRPVLPGEPDCPSLARS